MKKIIVIDSITIAISILGFNIIRINKMNPTVLDKGLQYIFGILIIVALIDLLRVLIVYINVQKATSKQLNETISGIQESTSEITRLSLLNEENVLIKEWDLVGKTSLLIGREHKEEQVDIDLGECEYSALIDDTHATLNYAGGEWFIEDLYSENGISIQKEQDNICYKLAKDRPCKVVKGDVIRIAYTRLLVQ